MNKASLGKNVNNSISLPSTHTALRRKCACGQHTISGSQCKECKKNESEFESVNKSREGYRNVTLSPTNKGTETLQSGSTETAVDGGSSTANCGVNGSWVSIPNGVTVPATLSGNKLGVPFDMIADFSPISSSCNCSAGEYRQYVNGTFKRNGATVVHPLCGTNLDPTNPQEDCARIGGTDYKYGYRSIPFATSKFTNPDQATGCRFVGFDEPGIRGSSGDNLEVDLHFTAELVDTQRGISGLQTAEWNVAGSATVP